jgi:hypothetical protein
MIIAGAGFRFRLVNLGVLVCAYTHLHPTLQGASGAPAVDHCHYTFANFENNPAGRSAGRDYKGTACQPSRRYLVGEAGLEPACP